MTNAFFVLWFIMLGLSLWGGIRLALKVTKNAGLRVLLSLVFIVIFFIGSTVAVMAGCEAAGGRFNVH